MKIRDRGNESRSQRGFTLVEIIVVLAIIGLMLAVIPPLLPNVISGAKVKAAARDIVSSLRYARSQAVARQKEMTLTLDVENKTYSISNKQKQLDLPKDTELKLITARSEQVDEQKGSIRFFPDGSSTGGQVKLNYEQLAFLIDVNWLTGQIKIIP